MKTISHDEAVKILLAGGVGVMPTDTVYGLVARAAERTAVDRLFALKQRERKPAPVIAASVEQLVQLGVPEARLRKVAHLWPDSVSVIVPGNEELLYLHQGLGDFPVRVPRDNVLREWLTVTGALVASSANQPGAPTAMSWQTAWEYFGDSVDFYVDGGDLSGRLPSTIVRVGDDGAIEVIRQGSVSIPT